MDEAVHLLLPTARLEVTGPDPSDFPLAPNRLVWSESWPARDRGKQSTTRPPTSPPNVLFCKTCDGGNNGRGRLSNCRGN
jgi:hypothetical protein